MSIPLQGHAAFCLFLPVGRALTWGQLGWVGELGAATSSQYYLGIRVSFV